MGSGRSHPQAVQSYEADGAAMLFVVEANKDAVHESHIAVEVVGGAGSRVKVRANAGEIQIGFANHPAEVGNDRWIVAWARRRTSVNWTGKEKVCTGWCTYVRDGTGNGLALVVFPFIVRKGRRPQSRAEQESSSSGRA